MNILTRSLLLAVAVSVTSATLYALGGTSPTLPVASAKRTAAEAILLPTIVVTPEEEPILLATVTVRAGGPADTGHRGDAIIGAVDYGGATATSGPGMPYYSFGRPLPRANRE